MSGASDDADVRVICGPTAAGKSAVALWLADRAPTTIISADSRQIYRGFDIGTAKPSADIRSSVPHRGVDVAEPSERYSAAAWSDAAAGWIAESRAAARVPLVVGGTGLYLRALFDGLFEEPSLDPERRRDLAAACAHMELAELRRWVQTLDPPRAHLGRTQLVRAIEVALLTGRRMSDLHREQPRRPRWQPRYLVVDPGAALAGHIARRIDDMFDSGWTDEVRGLMESVPADAPAWGATGYDAVRRLVRGELTRAETREAILVDTRQYAKRQRTWFRHQLPADRVTRVDPLMSGWEAAVTAWNEGGA